MYISVFSRPTFSIASIVQIPGVCQHYLEVGIIVDRSADIRVVISKFVQGDDVVTLLGFFITPGQASVGFKRLKEIYQHFLFSLLPCFNIRVRLSIVELFDITEFQGPTFVYVKLCEGFLNYALPESIQFSSNVNNKFIDIKCSIIIFIKKIKKLSAFILTDLDSKIFHCFPKFLNFKSTRAIIVHDFEDSLQTNHSSCSSTFEHLSELLNKFVV